MAIDKIKANSLGTTGTASSSTYLRGDMSWSANPLGDVVGPASSTDDALAKFDSTTGKLLQNSNATLSDAGTLTATAFAGPLTGAVTGNVTGNASGTAATVTGATQSNITALGTIVSLVATTADINAGTFDGIVGGTTPAAVSATQVDITAQGDLRLQDTTGGEYVAIQAAGTTTTYTLTMPAAVATTTGQALTSSDAGVASWSDVDSLPTQTSKDGYTLITDGTDPSWSPTPGRNLMINGDFKVAQRGTTYNSTTPTVNNDDTYTLDRWILLSDGNDIVDQFQSTSAIDPSGQYCCALSVETINKKFGIFQMAERSSCVDYINTGDCTLSFKARVTGSSLTNVKAAIVGWSSTQDTSASDIVSAWNVAGTDPTLIANWAYESAPANLSLSGTVKTVTITAPIDSTANIKNIGIFIWSDVTTTTLTDELQIADVQLERGSVATPFEHQKYNQVLAECRRFYFEMDTSIVAYSSNGVVGMRWPEQMRTDAPNIFWRYPNNTGTDYNVYRIDTGAQNALTSGNTIGKNRNGMYYWYNTGGSWANWASTAIVLWISVEDEL